LIQASDRDYPDAIIPDQSGALEQLALLDREPNQKDDQKTTDQASPSDLGWIRQHREEDAKGKEQSRAV